MASVAGSEKGSAMDAMSVEEIRRSRVNAGAAFFDRLIPTWWAHVDPVIININDSDNCLLGQLEAAHDAGKLQLNLPLQEFDPYSLTTRAEAAAYHLIKRSDTWGGWEDFRQIMVDHGWWPDDWDGTSHALTMMWQEEILRRRRLVVEPAQGVLVATA